MGVSEDLAALARHALGHATERDMGRILRLAGEAQGDEPRPWEQPSHTGEDPEPFDTNARPA